MVLVGQVKSAKPFQSTIIVSILFGESPMTKGRSGVDGQGHGLEASAERSSDRVVVI